MATFKFKDKIASASKSPFNKIVEVNYSYDAKTERKSENADWRISLRSSLFNFLINTTNQIPNDDIRKLPDAYQAIFGTLFYFIVGIVIYLLLLQSMRQNSPTLAPHPFSVTEKESSYQTSSPFGDNCSFIPIEMSGAYRLDNRGTWSSSDSFISEYAQYNLKLVAYSGTFSEYKSTMTGIFDYVNTSYVSISKVASIVPTIAFWMTFAVQFGNLNSYLSLAGDPSTIFKSDIVAGYLSNRYGTCSVPSISALSTYSMTAYLSYTNSTAYINNEFCMDIMNASMVNNENSQPITNQNSFQISIDVVSVMVAWSINSGIISNVVDSTLISIAPSVTPIKFPDKNISEHNADNQGFLLSIDVTYKLYPGMAPVTCFIPWNNTLYNTLSITSKFMFCGVKYYNTIAIPIFNQKGGSTQVPIDCDCLQNTTECSNFDFIYGVAILNNFNFYSDYTLHRGLLFTRLWHEMFNATFIGSYWGQNTANPDIRSLETSNEAFKYCFDVVGYNCSLLLFSSVNMNPSQYHFMTPQGYTISEFCVNNFLPSKGEWDDAINNPPANFEENYMVCTKKAGTLFINAAGVSVANLFTILPLISLIVSGIVLAFVTKYKVPVTYSESDKAQALDALATALLLARDKRLTKSITKQDFVLNEIVSNLEYTANLDTFLVATEVEETRRGEVIEFEMSRISTIINPISSGQEEAQESVILNNYHLDNYNSFRTFKDLQQFLERMIGEMREIMRVRYEIHGDRTDIHNKSAYTAVRSIFTTTANFKNAHFECFKMISEGSIAISKAKDTGTSNSTLRPKDSKHQNHDFSDRFSMADHGPEVGSGHVVLYDQNDDVQKVKRTLSELLYIHGKLAIGENMDDTFALGMKLASDLNFSKKIAYQIGSYVISLQQLIDSQK